MECKCKYEDKIIVMCDDVKDIKKDVRNLLQFKWAILGVIAAITFFMPLLVTYFSKGE
jgi:hypothetical protein